MNNTGWVKLWRQLLQSDVFADAELLRVFIWCLLRANHSPRSVAVKTGRGQTVIRVEAGQFIFGRNTAAQELGSKPTPLWKRIQRLEKMGCICLKRNRHFSIITIVNWGTFQGGLPEREQPKEQPKEQAKEQPRNNQGTTKEHKQEGKEFQECEEERESGSPAPVSFSPPSLEEVKDYCRERGGKVDAERWYDHYAAVGWKMGSSTMCDWKAAVRKWEHNGIPNADGAAKPSDTFLGGNAFRSNQPPRTIRGGRVAAVPENCVYNPETGELVSEYRPPQEPNERDVA